VKNIPRILVVDDDESLRKMLSGILRIKGYEVATAETGAEAMVEAERAFVNVALIDLKLPDMSGIEVLGRIKLATPLTEAIILTAHASLDTAVEATNKGAFSYLLKPCDIDKLLRHIHRALDQQQTQQEILRLASFPGMNPNPVLEVNAAGVITYLNPVAERLFPELAVAQPAPGALGDISASAATRSGERPELVRELRVGSTTFEQFLYPVPQSDLIRIYMLDVTERKRAAQALRENQARLDLALRSARMGVWHFDMIENRRYFDDQVCRLLGLDPATFNGTAEEFLGAIHPDDRETVKAALVRTIEQEVPYEPEYRAVWPDGSVHYITARGRLVRDDKGRPARINGIIWDITERKKSEEEQKLFRALVDQTTDAIEVLDPQTYRFLDVNQKACLALGYSREELLSLSAFDVDSTLDRSRAAEQTQKLRKFGSLTHEGRHRRKDGSEFPVEVSLGYVQLDRAYVVSVVRDITERKQAELALERANRALRTLSACNGALVHDRNEAELLASICRLIVETGGYRMAWVGFPEQDVAKTVRPVAHFGHEEGYLAAAKISWADNEFGRGPIGMAIRTGTVQVNQHFLTNPAMAPWQEAARPRGYQSSISLPLKNSAGILGVLTIYASEPDAFNEAEVRLLQELAADLAFGIETLRAGIEHDRIVHEHLRDAEILMQSLEDSIKAIAATVEMRDAYTAGHQRRVGQLAVAIASELGLPEGTIRGIELAASIHDLGKIGVPAEILSKPTKLTDLELMLVKNHAQAGYDILKDIKFPWPIATMVWQHHERLDGSGYPQGLKGEQILLESRIMGVADVVEAMASHRPYRAALGIDIALKEIERGRDSAYDAAVVDACVRLFAEKRFAFSA